jgi:hypothetical protein
MRKLLSLLLLFVIIGIMLAIAGGVLWLVLY